MTSDVSATSMVGKRRAEASRGSAGFCNLTTAASYCALQGMTASDREMPGPDSRPTVDGSPLDPTAHLARPFCSFPGCRGLRVIKRAQSSQTLQEFDLVLRWVLPRSETFCICGHPGTRDILVRTTSCLRYTRLRCPLFAAAPRSDAAFLWQRDFGATSCEKGTDGVFCLAFASARFLSARRAAVVARPK